jgi:hypothetical protein
VNSQNSEELANLKAQTLSKKKKKKKKKKTAPERITFRHYIPPYHKMN